LRKSILKKKHFENTILFYIFKITFKVFILLFSKYNSGSVLFCIMKNIFLEVFLPITGE